MSGSSPPKSGDGKSNKDIALYGFGALVAIGVGVGLYKWFSSKPAVHAEEKKIEANTVETQSAKKAGKLSEAAPAPAAPSASSAATSKSPPREVQEETIETPTPVVNQEPTAGVLSRENLIALFSEMIEEMSHIIYRLQTNVSVMQSQGASEEELQKFFQAQYTAEIERTHNKLLLKYKTTEEAADAAAKVYEHDPQFVKLMQQLDKMQRALQGEQPSDSQLARIPSWLDLDNVILIFGDVMKTVTSSILAAMEHVYKKHEGKVYPNKEIMLETEIQAFYRTDIEEKKGKLFSKYNIDEELFDLALTKYSTSEKLSKKIEEFQLKQKRTVETEKQRIKSLYAPELN